MELYYPRPELAIGGLVGLALFFMAAGMGINESRNTRSLRFDRWYLKRIVRIHPSVITSAILIQLLIFSEWKTWTAIDYPRNLVHPLPTYHFLKKLFVYYVPLYFYVRWNYKLKHVVGLTACGLFVLAAAIPDIREQLILDEPLRTGYLAPAFLWSVFFSTVILGVWMSDCRWLLRSTCPRSLWSTGAVVCLIGVLYLGTKFLMAKVGFFTEAFLILYVFGIALAISLVVFLSDERLVDRVRKSNSIVSRSVMGIGTISLEIYLTHTLTILKTTSTKATS